MNIMQLIERIKLALGLTKTVDGVLSAFNKVVADLESVENRHQLEMAAQAKAIQAAQEAHAAALKESNRARQVRDKIAALIGEGEHAVEVGVAAFKQAL